MARRMKASNSGTVKNDSAVDIDGGIYTLSTYAKLGDSLGDRRFLLDAQHFVMQVAALVGSKKTTQNQFDALVSFQYNTGHLAGSTLLTKHLAGDFKSAAAEFAKWVHAGGHVLPGLVKRRAAEAALYLKA